MSWRSLPVELPEEADESQTTEVAGEVWEFRRIGKTTWAQLGELGPILELPGLSKLSGMWNEPDLAAAGTERVIASPPSLYIATGTAPLGLDDVTCGDYAITWYDLEAVQMFEEGVVVLDGGEEVLSPPDGPGGRVAVFLRRTSL